MELKLGGYLPRRIALRPIDWLRVPAVVDVCSVSGCLSPVAAADGRLRNALRLYDTPATARRAATGSDWRLFAYKWLPMRYDEHGRAGAWLWPSVAPRSLPRGFRSLGFDVVSTSSEIGFQADCSPLSCNGAAERWPVNAHCLLDDLDVAVAAARRFADGAEPVEPGPYFVAEVLCADDPTIA